MCAKNGAAVMTARGPVPAHCAHSSERSGPFAAGTKTPLTRSTEERGTGFLSQVQHDYGALLWGMGVSPKLQIEYVNDHSKDCQINQQVQDGDLFHGFILVC